MAKGFQRDVLRKQQLENFTRELVRRYSAQCELCGARKTKLTVFEVPPVSTEINIEHCILLCETCLQQISHPKLRNIDHWRCLATAVWSEHLAAQVMAVMLTRYFAKEYDWAANLEDTLYLSPEADQWLSEIESFV
ncbi:hypothetical protein [Zooshikella ganghwensis]|uniref:PhnA protein n=1 Tax=Zooshikella ganghwensis TaxID=202772 RepID=A0A4P9VKT8_9GAMM|nr:hypothetical protein [Zooshikella ganghwensis]RDH43925.1 phnA protein [Zooshikella ganghwensis]